jgi:hypothetical protein
MTSIWITPCRSVHVLQQGVPSTAVKHTHTTDESALMESAHWHTRSHAAVPDIAYMHTSHTVHPLQKGR